MKKITVKEIHQFLNAWAHPSLAEDWDNIGLQLGSLRAEVEGVLISLDVTEAVLDEAKKKKCNLLITHHPLSFKPPSQLNPKSIPARLAKQARRSKINILSFHTNLDSCEEGLNDLLAKQLKLKQLRPLVRKGNSERAGMGRIGFVQAMSLRQFLKKVSQAMKLKHFRFVGSLQTKVKKIAVVTGSGAGFYLEAKKQGADVLVTGDVKYHTALDALSEKMALIDIGHFAGEIGMTQLVASKLKTWLKQNPRALTVYTSSVQKDPLQYWPL